MKPRESLGEKVLERKGRRGPGAWMRVRTLETDSLRSCRAEKLHLGTVVV
jgi:hypothetical protein